MGAESSSLGEEDKHTTYRQVLKQKWENMEHHDRLDQNLLVSIFALLGGGIAVMQKEKITAEAVLMIQWFSVLLGAAAVASVFRSFTEYYRSLGVICRMEQALGVYDNVGETPSFPDPTNFGLLAFLVAAKFLRTWRVSLLAIYGIIGAVSLDSVSHYGMTICALVTSAYVVIAFLWFVAFPLKRSSA